MGARNCSIEDCEKPSAARGWCHGHYKRWQKYGNPLLLKAQVNRGEICAVMGCGAKADGAGWCREHPRDRNANMARKRTGSVFNRLGYAMLYFPEHPNAGKGGCVGVHTVVMSEILGRPLRKGESVHHVNGIRDDNRAENLQLWVSPQKPGQRVSDLVRYAVWIIAEYGDDPAVYEGNGRKGNMRDRHKYVTT